MKARALAQVAVIRFERSRDVRIGHELIDPPAVLLHDPEVEFFCLPHVFLDARTITPGRVLDGGEVMGPTVVGEVGPDRAAEHDGLEVVHPGLLPARLKCLNETRVGGPVASNPDGRRRALEHVDVFGRLRERRQALQPAGARPDQRDNLVTQIGHRLTRPAAGVGVIPSRGVKCRAVEAVHPRDRRQLHQVEDSDGEHVVAAAERVALVGVDRPPLRFVVPYRAGDPGVEEGTRDQIEAVG